MPNVRGDEWMGKSGRIAERCQVLRRDGTPCRAMAVTDGRCYVHAPTVEEIFPLALWMMGVQSIRMGQALYRFIFRPE